MPDKEITRIDKFLWAVRIYKTRSVAAEECRKGRITINNLPVKPSHTVSEGMIISVRKLPSHYAYEVLKSTGNRVSASLVHNFIKDLTPAEEKTRALIARSAGFGHRPRGVGRPTKKDRRRIDKISNLSD